MSYTYDLACRTCRKYLWVGQGWPKQTPDKRYIYFEDRHREALQRFLYDHETDSEKHELVFASSESGITSGYDDSDSEG